MVAETALFHSKFALSTACLGSGGGSGQQVVQKPQGTERVKGLAENIWGLGRERQEIGQEAGA